MTTFEWAKAFASNLKAMMREYEMSQSDLAQETGLSKATITNYLTGERVPYLPAVIKISYALDCDLADLIDFGENIDD